jgi:hypothetical protein
MGGFGAPPGGGFGQPPSGGFGAPPPGGFGAPPPGGGGAHPMARSQVGAPAIALIVVAGIAIALQLLAIVINLIGAAGPAAFGGEYAHLASGAVGIVLSIVNIAMAGFIIFGAIQMKNLASHTMALVAAILALIPVCNFPCCVLLVPFGIWALVVILKPEVKAAFSS